MDVTRIEIDGRTYRTGPASCDNLFLAFHYIVIGNHISLGQKWSLIYLKIAVYSLLCILTNLLLAPSISSSLTVPLIRDLLESLKAKNAPKKQ